MGAPLKGVFSQLSVKDKLKVNIDTLNWARIITEFRKLLTVGCIFKKKKMLDCRSFGSIYLLSQGTNTSLKLHLCTVQTVLSIKFSE